MPLESDTVFVQSQTFAPLSARRLLLLGGMGLILVGMIFGDIFAVFVLHQNAARVGASLAAASHAALGGDSAAVVKNFQNVGSFLENRGTKVDTHVHIIAFGYVALMLALLVPWMTLSATTKKRLAWLLLCGAGLLPLCVFLIHYVGLAYSPLQAIGWASIFADLGGLLVIVALAGFLYGLVKRFLSAERAPVEDELLAGSSATGRSLLAGGSFLVLLGFLHGTYYAAVDLYRHEALDYAILSQISVGAAGENTTAVEVTSEALSNGHFGWVEFGLLAMLLAYFQPYVNLRAAWKQRWAVVLLLGSVLLPVCVLLELNYGLVAGGLADIAGLLVIVAMLAMWIGILRYTGKLDAGGAT